MFVISNTIKLLKEHAYFLYELSASSSIFSLLFFIHSCGYLFRQNDTYQHFLRAQMESCEFSGMYYV